MILLFIAALSASSAAASPTATLTVCNASDARLAWVGILPSSSAPHEPVPVQSCISIPGVTLGTKEILFYYNISCIHKIDVGGDMAITFSQAMKDACDAEEDRIGAAMWDE
jgi:hypothetical protein